MHKGTKRALILSLILAVCGAGLVIAGIALGGQPNFSVDIKNRTITAGGADLTRGDRTPQAFTALEIDVATADITVERGADWALSYALPDAPVITEEGGVLRLSAQEQSTIGFVGVSFAASNGPAVTVTVPEGAALDRITLHTATGEVRLSGLTVGALDVTSNTGDIDAAELIVSGEVNAQTNTGSITLALTGRTSDYAMELGTDTGEVRLNGTEHGHDYTTDHGIPLRAETNTGDVSVRFE